MDRYIHTTGEVLAQKSERLYEVRTPIGKVVRGFVERKDEGDVAPEVGDAVELQFQHEDLSRARIMRVVEG